MSEQERIASLMHKAFNEWVVTTKFEKPYSNSNICDWDTVSPGARNAYMAVALAVIADRDSCPEPIILSTGERT